MRLLTVGVSGNLVKVFHFTIGPTMNFILQPWQLLFMILAGWVNREQPETIEYLRTENQVLKEKLGKKRILLSDDQRRRLAVKGKILGRKRLQEIGTLFAPDTILGWHRKLVAKKWDYTDMGHNVSVVLLVDGKSPAVQLSSMAISAGSGSDKSRWKHGNRRRPPSVQPKDLTWQ